ncbi:MAG: DUF4157 domain-containing protein [Dehalococcoidia bacterium]|nr:DUF4157 domain-containing protein [Dehalococcoidia bacterium]
MSGQFDSRSKAPLQFSTAMGPAIDGLCRSHALDSAKSLTDNSRSPLVSQPPLLQSETGCSRYLFGSADHARQTPVQAKLKIGPVNDPYEREADQMAEMVMSMPEPKTDDNDNQCRLPGCPGTLQRQAANSALPGQVPSVVHEALSYPGQPMDTGTRMFMESRFGYDFGRVRVHSDSRAADSARAINALAYTVGSDVVFGDRKYAPATAEGRTILGHELAHVIQQGGNREIIRRWGEGIHEKVTGEAADVIADEDVVPVAAGKSELAFLQKGSALVLKLILGCDRLKLRLFDLR